MKEGRMDGGKEGGREIWESSPRSRHAFGGIYSMYVYLGQAELYRKYKERVEGQENGKRGGEGVSRDWDRGGGETKLGKRVNKGGQSRAYKREIMS